MPLFFKKGDIYTSQPSINNFPTASTYSPQNLLESCTSCLIGPLDRFCFGTKTLLPKLDISIGILIPLLPLSDQLNNGVSGNFTLSGSFLFPVNLNLLLLCSGGGREANFHNLKTAMVAIDSCNVSQVAVHVWFSEFTLQLKQSLLLQQKLNQILVKR